MQAVIFDLDGVIADTEPLHAEAFEQVTRQLGFALTTDVYMSDLVGLDDRDLFRAYVDRCGADLRSGGFDVPATEDPAVLKALILAKAAAFETRVSQGCNAVPGVNSFVSGVADVLPVAIASGAMRRDIELVLRHVKLDGLIDVIVSADDVEKSKPHPQTYLDAIHLLGNHAGVALNPSECVAIEDTPTGLQAAKSAGLRTIAVTTTRPPEDLHLADLILENFQNLTLDALDGVLSSPRQA